MRGEKKKLCLYTGNSFPIRYIHFKTYYYYITKAMSYQHVTWNTVLELTAAFDTRSFYSF